MTLNVALKISKFTLELDLGLADEFGMKDDGQNRNFPLKKTLSLKTWKFTLSKPVLPLTPVTVRPSPRQKAG